MKFSMYPRLAWRGIRKNKQLYLPYILTAVAMVAMFYIVTALAYADIEGTHGGSTIVEILGLGSWVMAIFSAIFLFYTSSFLMRRRQREFGLYNILGMGKRHIGGILFCETLITMVISLALGLSLGALFCKLAEAAMLNILKLEIGYELTVSTEAIIIALPIFAAIFGVILISSLLRIRLSSPIALLHGDQSGERPPKANPIIAIIGVILLAAAYYIAVTTENPILAMLLFFLAVVMVIVGTYALFISGSVALCRLLQKNKRYYYKSENFISVSSMTFRMKRNGAGLASICILLTMVLVMITSTACLFASEEQILYQRYPRDITGRLVFRYYENFSNDEIMADLRQNLDSAVTYCGGEPENTYFFRMAMMTSWFENGVFRSENDLFLDQINDFDKLFDVFLMPLRDYNEISGTSYTLANDEALIYTVRCEYEDSSISIGNVGTYRVAGHVDDFPDVDEMLSSITSSIVMIVNDVDAKFEPIEMYSNRFLYYGYDVADGMDETVSTALWNFKITDDDGGSIYPGLVSFSVQSREANRVDFYSLYGGIFFLGIMLSIVFILAAVLIIYYKQISEGYEDSGRFDIMQKVGLTAEDIKRSINAQMRTVFILPIAAATLHLCFAFPIIQRMLLLFNFRNTTLLVITACACVLSITVIYLIVYKLTAGAYYKLVSGGERE